MLKTFIQDLTTNSLGINIYGIILTVMYQNSTKSIKPDKDDGQRTIPTYVYVHKYSHYLVYGIQVFHLTYRESGKAQNTVNSCAKFRSMGVINTVAVFSI